MLLETVVPTTFPAGGEDSLTPFSSRAFDDLGSPSGFLKCKLKDISVSAMSRRATAQAKKQPRSYGKKMRGHIIHDPLFSHYYQRRGPPFAIALPLSR